MRVSEAFGSVETARLPFGEPEPQPDPNEQARLELGPRAAEPMDLLDQRIRKGVESFAERIKVLTRLATDVPIRNVEEGHKLTETLVEAKQLLEQLDEWQHRLTDPLKQKAKTIEGIFNPLKLALRDEKRKTGFMYRAGKLLAAFKQQEEARVRREQEAARLAQEEAARKEAEAEARVQSAETPAERQEALAAAEEASRAQTQALVSAPELPVKGFKGEMGSASIREVWRFEVVKPELVPREYLAPDEKAIRAAVAAGVREIAGVNISQAQEVAVRIGK